MAISSQAEYFLNAFYILKRNASALEAIQTQRAQEHNAKNPNANVQAIGNSGDLQTGVVDFVCLAFAVELYLKAVFEILGSKKRGHKIHELFNKLPSDIQNTIFRIHMQNVHGATLDSYKKQMRIIRNGFEEFRYSYEYKELSYHTGFALKMIDAMRQVISETRKSKLP